MISISSANAGNPPSIPPSVASSPGSGLQSPHIGLNLIGQLASRLLNPTPAMSQLLTNVITSANPNVVVISGTTCFIVAVCAMTFLLPVQGTTKKTIVEKIVNTEIWCYQ